MWITSCLYQILGTGLSVSGSANNSGPYSNLTFDTGAYSGQNSTVCASITGLTATRGIHGLSCTSQALNAGTAILLDASNNSIEDVTIAGVAHLFQCNSKSHLKWGAPFFRVLCGRVGGENARTYLPCEGGSLWRSFCSVDAQSKLRLGEAVARPDRWLIL